MPREVIKIMVSSSVYGYERDLRVLCATMESYKSSEFKYKILNSYIGTIYVAPGVSNTEACLRAVDECDFFLGIILPKYGSGIAHKEFTRAVEQDKPRGYLCHYSVRYARELLAQYMYCKNKRYAIPKWETNVGYTTVIFPGVTITTKHDAVNDAVKNGIIDTVSDTVCDALIDTVNTIVTLKKGASIKDIMDATGKSNATVKRYIQVLRKIDLIEFKGAAKTGRYYLTKKAEKVIHSR